jgi:hypothetical protein
MRKVLLILSSVLLLVAATPKQPTDWTKVEQAFGRAGSLQPGDVYKVSFPSMGMAIALNFQPTGSGRAAITGDFVLRSSEVNPVIRILRGGGIEVTALHSHVLEETPRLFFMHFWANDDARKLATTLRAALDAIQR